MIRFWLAVLLIWSWIVIIAVHAHAQDKPRMWRVCVVTSEGLDPARCRLRASLPEQKELRETSIKCPDGYQLVNVLDERVICAVKVQ